jgi:hypothetical protein
MAGWLWFDLTAAGIVGKASRAGFAWGWSRGEMIRRRFTGQQQFTRLAMKSRGFQCELLNFHT